MADRYIFSSESVGEGHPDKVCDTISDAILDACLRQDKTSRVACETFAKSNVVAVGGEITVPNIGRRSMDEVINVNAVIRAAVREIGYVNDDDMFHADKIFINNSLTTQSPDIAQGVDARKAKGKKTAEQGAGDQGIMFGFACDETPELMPAPIMYAHRLGRELTRIRKAGKLAPWLRPDAKSQVSVEYVDGKPTRVTNVVISTQHAADVEHATIEKFCIENIVRKVIPAKMLTGDTEFLINPTGRFVVGGPQGDSGLTGRKIIVDTYGGMGRHGGGAFSGKGPLQGGPQRRVHGPLGGEEHRRRRSGQQGGSAVRVRDRPPQAGQRAHRHLRHRQGVRRQDPGRRAQGVQLQAGRHRQAAQPAPSDLLEDDQLRSLRQGERRRPHVGNHQQGRSPAEGGQVIRRHRIARKGGSLRGPPFLLVVKTACPG
jgi:S-adenosylmethionine synthetase